MTAGRKRFRIGTHRVVAPEQTLATVAPLLAGAGITRLAVVTGLDRVGIPVVVVTRPASRSLSVSMGKGVTTAAAKASGVMEALELHRAETVPVPALSCAVEDLGGRGHLDVSRLPTLAGSPFSIRHPVPWVTGRTLPGGEPVLVPYELVHTDGRVPMPSGSGCFPCTSNGLASGNSWDEAVTHALCEVVERDAVTLWQLSPAGVRAGRRLDPATVDDPVATELLARFDAAGLTVLLSDVTSDVGLACVHCTLLEAPDVPRAAVYTSTGAGCHPARSVALVRALTEAAQSRLALVCGARDDVFRDEYEVGPDSTRAYEALLAEAPLPASRSVRDLPDAESDDVADDVGTALARLAAVGLDEVAAVDLGPPDAGVAVVRVVVPGLEPHRGGGYWPGERARRLSAGVAPAQAAGAR